MRVLIINVVCGIRSTGRICTDLAAELEKQGHEVKIAYGRETVPEQFQKYAVRIGNSITEKVYALSCRLFDNDGFSAKGQTKQFLKWVDEYNPEMLWLHNLHGYYINVEMLFDWIKSRPNMEVKWTLHDCWAFTGHCPYFSMVGCEKWQTYCKNCPQKRDYPGSFIFDNSSRNYTKKKSLFNGVANMEIVTPSNWLAGLVKKSFLKNYAINVVYNRIDENVFKPTSSDFRERFNLDNKIIVLGVASVWSKRKGLDDFIELSKLLDEHYMIVLVGLDKYTSSKLGDNILAIGRTNSKRDLAAIYTAADYFFNPSKEETFGLTTLEAISCGTKSIVYQGTACEEIARKYGGITVPQDIKCVYRVITTESE